MEDTSNLNLQIIPYRKHWKQTYCINCGRYDHDYNTCKDATISTGVILLKFDYKKIRNSLSGLIKRVGTNSDIIGNGISIDSIDDISLFSKINDSIRFLLIRRRYTLGYVEFIRGRYRPDDVDGIVGLFQQMTSMEIDKLVNSNIEDLWDEFWLDKNKKYTYDKEFAKSKQKFEKLKNASDGEIPLSFYSKHVTPLWSSPEWGFPKGRRNKMETNKECAMREFEEETGYARGEYVLLEGIKPFVEDFMGTNNVRYKHIYYVGYASNDKDVFINESSLHQVSEIGDIGYYSYNEVIHMIRPYHTERKKIITNLYTYIVNKIILDIKQITRTTESNDNNLEDEPQFYVVKKDNKINTTPDLHL